MRALIRRVVLGFFLIGMGTAARAEWLEASTSHFVVYGNVPPRKITAFADKLERFGAAVRYLFELPEPEGGASNRVIIYLVSGIGGVQRYYRGRTDDVAGFYRNRPEGPVIFTPDSVDSSGSSSVADEILFHEFTHHMLLSNSAAIYPGWLSEGLAEVLGTAMFVEKGAVRLGAPLNSRASAILTDSPMRVRDLLDLDGRDLNTSQLSQKYARGWLLTHYLLLSGKRAGQYRAYYELLAKGVKSVDAGAQAFGDLRELDRDLNRYRSTGFNSVVIPADRLTAEPVVTRALSRGEAAMMPHWLSLAAGLDDAEARKIVTGARKIAAEHPTEAWVQRVAAELEYRAGNLAEAEAAADRALAIDPKNLMAMTTKARAQLLRAIKAEPRDRALFTQARSTIVKANRLDPDFALPLVLFYTSFRASGEPARPNAVDGLLRAVELAPRSDSVRLLAFGALLDRDDLPGARRMLAPVAFSPHARADNPARTVLAQIDDGADLATVRAAAVHAKLIGNQGND